MVIVTVGGRVVQRTTRAEETSPLGGRGGWGSRWLADGLVIPGIPEERHASRVLQEMVCSGFGYEGLLAPIARDYIAKIRHERHWDRVDLRPADLWRMRIRESANPHRPSRG